MAVRVEKEKFTRGRDGRMQFRVRWLASTREEAIFRIPDVYDGLLRTDHQGTPWISESDGRYLVDAVYEGLTEDPDEEFDQCEIAGELREVKIEAFPNRELLVEKYGAYEEDGKLKFPAKIPKEQLTGSGLSTVNSEQVDNPFFNATTYTVEYELAVHQFVRRRVPQSILKKQLTVVNRLPAVFGYTGETKSWFIRPVRRRKVGNAWEITVEYQQVDEFTDVQAMIDLRKTARKETSVLDTFFR